MLEVFLDRRRRDENIVDVRVAKIKTAKNLVDESLESLRSVPQAKRHFQEFVHSERRSDRRLRDIVLRDRNLVICPNQVDSGEKFLP